MLKHSYLKNFINYQIIEVLMKTGERIEEIKLSRWDKAKIVTTAAFGTFADYYDFQAAAYVSATVWPAIFFSEKTPQIALLVSIAALGLGYVARPFGAILFGHVGDKLGRLRAMIVTLTVIGVAVVGITILPPYATIGIFASTLLVIFRLLLGLGIGGEIGGGWTWAAEATSDSKFWPFWAGIVQAMGIVGISISPLLFGILQLNMSHSDFLNWGWRIPFAIGASIIIIAAIIRYKTAESPIFKALMVKRKVERVPLATLVKENPRNFLALIMPFAQPAIATPFILVPFSLLYIQSFGVPYALAGTIESPSVAIGGALGVLLGAFLSVYFSRRQYLVLIGTIGAWIYLYPMFLILRTANLTYAALAWGSWYFLNETTFGVFPSLATSLFPARYRYSAAATSLGIGASISGAVVAIFLPQFVSNPVVGLNGLFTVYSVLAMLAIISLFIIKGKGDIKEL